ncbi:DNA topoisomerase IB [Ramlibacter tataouinensis]|uniref:DNA topoisomerase IB n=1 Tax=Ramlibacter tataouinensis TaxID=94132 RepID=UPI0022F39F04|nr:DNA topoisomerase IB [Ramlibacter tataouinensis]WBY02673.1 DNA topoisomerase IB [Ramlibacter tataouinensis]
MPTKQQQAPDDGVPGQAARAAGLVHVSDEDPGIRREPAGDGFSYFHANGSAVRDERTLARIRSLAVPPAWTGVWICPSPQGHLQATGRDARGRKQYRYHPRFREVREQDKYEHMLEFAQALPQLRATVARHMALPGLSREKVLATLVHLLESTLIRVGNDDYARQNRSFGLTTLRNRHVAVEGAQLRFRFQGKSGKSWRLQLHDRRVAKVVRACQELPGQRLFQYEDEDGQVRELTSTDVNAYLREISGSEITAKDFRTWGGTVMAALALQDAGMADTQAAMKKSLRDAIADVAARLGNTPAICRKCYVHPEVLAAWQAGELALDILPTADGNGTVLRPDEAAVLALLQSRLSRTVEGELGRSLAALQRQNAPASRR